jgi:acyl-CoA reductase-like NAD-dependent aldehyde dehydrogenase
VHINGPSVGDEPHVPFGGVGASGFGRLGGHESLHMFTEQKTLYMHQLP